MLRPRARPGHAYFAGAPLLIAHRGGARLAPENTMVAFVEAVELWGADMLELDVRLSADGEVVVIHDATVDRTTDGNGAVADLTWAQLSALDAGARFVDPEGAHSRAGQGITIPRFADLLERLPHTRLNVEAKCLEVAAPLQRVIMEHGAAHRVLFAAEHERNRRPARGYRGPWGASRSQLLPFALLHRTPLSALYTPAADALQVPQRWPLDGRGRDVVTPRLMHEAHRRNLPVHVWTVDDVEAMHRLLDLGVDGIQTDRPDRLARVLHERTGRELPPGLRDPTRAPTRAPASVPASAPTRAPAP